MTQATSTQATSTRATSTLAASRVATLVGDFARSPAYAGLAEALTLLIGDGRIPLGVRLPSERDLTAAVGVSRTTVTRAYAVLRDTGYAEARRGSGTYTRVPGGRTCSHDRAFIPRQSAGDDVVDLTCAATTAAPGIAAAYAEAATHLPVHLGGHGYFPQGLPALQEAIAAQYEQRGLPTEPDQVMVTAGALAAVAIVAQAYTGPRDRVLVESPVYPNATLAIRHSGARLAAMPVDPDGWDLDATGARLREVAAPLAYLVPDFQNPTGHLMTDEQRDVYATHLARAGTVAVVDEAHQALALDGQRMPRPFATLAPSTLTIGSASKTYWGGLRLGWIRAPRGGMERLTRARLGLDLGAPVLEQLVLLELLADPGVLAAQRSRLRTQRDRLVSLVAERLPDWRFRTPSGGQFLWCELPAALGTALAVEGERHGVVVSPGPVFAVEGGLDRFVRLPWARPVDELERGVERLVAAWEVVRDREPRGGQAPSRVMVA